jgi:hypothetical protein
VRIMLAVARVRLRVIITVCVMGWYEGDGVSECAMCM